MELPEDGFDDAAVTATDVVTVLFVLPLLATSEYEVVDVGETLIEPEVATAEPLSVTEVADCVLHVIVELCPAVMEVGEAVMVADGVAAAATATDVVAVLLVLPFFAMSVYEVVDVGETLIEPDVATAAPLSVTEVADCVLHVIVDFWPAVTEVGEALMLADNADTAATDTAVVALLLELPFLAMSTYDVFCVGATLVEPDVATAAPLSVTDVADCVLHVRVVFCPAVMETGEAVILADKEDLWLEWRCANVL